MIPYIEFHTIPIGPINIQVWGLFVALGILVGAWVSQGMLKRRGLNDRVVWDSLGWIVLASLIGARLFHVLFYNPTFYIANPLEIFAIWSGGMSIIGGFAGAVLAAMLFFRKHHLDVWKYADAMIFGLPIGLAIGRIGCFLIHDHPGTATDFFLGVRYPDGVTRFDHGLLLIITNAILFGVFLLMAKQKVKEGWYIVAFLLYYGVVRFGLDFLRAREGPIVDERYLGLTPAQYVTILFVFAALFLVKHLWKKPVV